MQFFKVILQIEDLELVQQITESELRKNTTGTLQKHLRNKE